MATRRYVKQNNSGAWDVLQEGHRRTTVHADTQAKAVARARAAVRRAGGGEVVVLDRSGKIAKEYKVSRKPTGNASRSARRAAA